MTSVDNLTNEIMRQLRAYESEITEGIEVTGQEVSEELVSRLEITSPDKRGSYKKGWRVKKVGNKFIVHNATDYQLTHLLEKGHALRQGGRSPVISHIAPAEQQAINEYLEKIERLLEQ